VRIAARRAIAALAISVPVAAVAAWAQPPAPARTYYVYVCAESEDEVALVRYGPAGAEVVKTIRVGSLPAEIEGPHGIGVSPDGRHWYVSISHGFPFGSVHQFETGTDEWVADLTLGMFPASLDISAAANFLYVVNFNLYGAMEPSTISIVETDTMTEIARVPTGIMPHGSRLSPDGKKHYSVNMMSDDLVELDALTFEISRRLPLSEAGAAMAQSQPGEHAHDPSHLVQPTWATRPTPQGYVYVAANNADKIFDVDLAQWKIRRTFSTWRGPYNLDVTPDGKMLIATYKKGAAIGFWDLESGTELARLDTTRTLPHGVVITPDGQYAFVTNEGVKDEPGTVEVYHIPTRARVATVEIGKQAGGIAFWKMEEPGDRNRR
jgi:DNA-binding beta-propeller fold protein YncE